MTTRPTSHLIHSGFLDILSLIPESTHPQPQSRRVEKAPVPPKKTEDDLRQILRDHASPRARKGKEREKKNVEVGLRKRKVDKEMIGPPMDFRYVMLASLSTASYCLILMRELTSRHVFHASTYEEATELLLRWAIEGVDCKVGGKSSTSISPLLHIPFQTQ